MPPPFFAHRRFRRAGLALAGISFAVAAAAATAAPGAGSSAQQFGPGVRTAQHDATGKLRFVGTAPGKPIPRPPGVAATAAPQVAARAFLRAHGAAFGLRDEARELRVAGVRSGSRGRSSVRFQQVHQGVPVIGGELVVNLDRTGNILSTAGEISPAPQLPLTAGVTASRAAATAVVMAAKTHRVARGTLHAGAPVLSIYDPRLLDAPGPQLAQLVWRTEVTGRTRDGIRELVLIDARTGKVALHFNQVANAKTRRVCDAANTPSQYPCTGPVRVEGQGPHPVTDVNLAYDYSGNMYDFLRTRFGRDSLDGNGMPLVSTVRWCPDASECPFENAFWDGKQMVYGEGFASADDVVGHEFAHGLTEFTSHLFYYHQSGAINESFSDVFGELLDLTNGRGDDSAAVRWEMGEDLTGVGAIRDMSDPTRFGDPDRMRSPNYTDDPDKLDSGGVHSNSGVNNKAAFLITDGGTFNNRTVTGLGVEKAARIYYEVETALLTSGSDYADLYNALPQACANLAGTAGITGADCTEVRDAVLATEMNLQPLVAATAQAPACPSGQFPKYVFNDELENPAAGRWARSVISRANSWYYPQNTHPYDGFDATYGTSGKFNFWGDDPGSDSGNATSDSAIAMTAGVVLPANAFFTFQHSYGFEHDSFFGVSFDGGVVEYSADGGPWTDAGSLFTHGGYNGTLDSGNPLGGRQAFVDRSYGYATGRLNLSSLAGRSVRFRFRIGSDQLVGDYGWFIDDVRIHTCSADLTAPAAGAPVQELPGGSVLNPTTTGASLPVRQTWAAATDDRALPRNIRYVLQQSVNGGAWNSLTAWTTRRAGPVQFLVPGTSYQYRVLARDEAGNVGTATGPLFRPAVTQESSSSLTYLGTWQAPLAQSTAYGGFVRPTTSVNATVRMPFTGRNVALVMPRAANLGTARTCLFQGSTTVVCQDLDLSPSGNLGARRIVFTRGGLNPALPYRLDVRATGGRVELDGFVVLR
jgi:bacillolysin